MSRSGTVYKHIKAILPHGAVNKTNNIVSLYKADKNAADIIQKEEESYQEYKERKEATKAEFLKKEEEEYQHKVLPLIKGFKTLSIGDRKLLSMATYYNYKDSVIEQSRHPLTKVRINRTKPVQVDRISLIYDIPYEKYLFINQNVTIKTITHMEIAISRFRILGTTNLNYYLIGIYKRGERDKKLDYFDWCTDRNDEEILWLYKEMKKEALLHLSKEV